MGNKLTGILTGIGCGLYLVVATGPLWLSDILADTRRVRLDNGGEVTVARWYDSSRTQVTSGTFAGSRLTDEGDNGSVDSHYSFCGVPKRWPMQVRETVTEKDQKLYNEAVSKFDSGEQMGLKGIYSSVKKAF